MMDFYAIFLPFFFLNLGLFLMIFKKVDVKDNDKNIILSIYGTIYTYTFLEFHYVLHKCGTSTKSF